MSKTVYVVFVSEAGKKVRKKYFYAEKYAKKFVESLEGKGFDVMTSKYVMPIQFSHSREALVIR